MRAFILSLLCLAVWAAGAQAQQTVTVMTYNLENFYDAVDDPRFPPSAEPVQSAAWVAAKAAAAARVIARFDGGRGPDILVLTEIESRAALDALRAALPGGGTSYPTAVIFDADPNRPHPKPDERGIKVALLSKLPEHAAGGGAKAHTVDLSGEASCNENGQPGRTRDILEVTLALPDGAPVSVFGAHLPSGLNPRVCREVAARRIETLAAALPSDRIVIAAGDFNFNCKPAEQNGLKHELAGWSLPPQLDNGCRGAGSNYFGGENSFSFLDVIAQRGPASHPWRLDHRTFRAVLTDSEQLIWDNGEKVLRPKRFEFNQTTGKSDGVSDHWPVASDLVKP